MGNDNINMIVEISENDLFVEKTRDYNSVFSILCQPGIWEKMTTTGCKKDANLLDNDNAHFYLFKKNDKNVGFAVITKFDKDIYMGEWAFLPEVRGKEALIFTKIGLKLNDFLFNYPLIVAKINKKNKPAEVFCKLSGLNYAFEDNFHNFYEWYGRRKL